MRERFFGSTTDLAKRIRSDVMLGGSFTNYGKKWTSKDIDFLYALQPVRHNDDPVDYRTAADMQTVMNVLNYVPIGAIISYQEDMGNFEGMTLKKIKGDKWVIIKQSSFKEKVA